MTRYLLAMSLTAVAMQQMPPRDVAGKSQQGTAIVAGVVFAGATGTEPARRARVMLADTSGIADGRAVTTDDGGRFEFREVSAGRYTIEVYKPGFLRSYYGATRPGRAGTPVPVTDGGRIDGLTIRIAQGGAISGTIRDDRGRPVPSVNVMALRYGYSFSGERRLSSAGNGTTDDRGVYRIGGLAPSDYIVVAEPRVNTLTDSTGVTDFQVLSPADVDRLLSGKPSPVPVAPARRANYATQFFPGTTDHSRAVTIAVAGAEERTGVDLALAWTTTAKIQGTVTMPDGSAAGAVTVTLTPAGDVDVISGGIRPRSVGLDAAGQFEFSDISPGSYTITAKTRATSGRPETGQQAVLYAQAAVSVSGQDFHLPLQLSPAMTVTGRLAFQGASAPPKNLTAIQVYLVPPNSGGNLGAGPTGGQVSSEARFRFEGVTPGPYRMITSSKGGWNEWWLHSAVANGRDALDQPLVVAPGQDVDLVITYTDRPTEITGVFQDAAGRPAPEYFIVVLPADPAAWVPGSRRIRNTRPDSDGRFSIKGLPAGDYLMAALTDLLPEELNDRNVLEALLPGVRITLVDGQTTRQDLRIGK